MHPLQSAYDFYMEKLKSQMKEVTATKKVLNELARGMELEAPFANEEPETLQGTGASVRIDEFVNKQPSTALQEYLTKRGQNSGAVVWDDVVDIFRKGGFDFGKFGGEKAVRMTLIKNTTAFKFIRKQNAFGLKIWYGNDQKPKKKESAEVEPENKEGKKKRGRPAKQKDLEVNNTINENKDT